MAFPLIPAIAAGAAAAATSTAVQTAISAVGSLYSEAKNQIPRLDDEVTVEVVGQPGASKKQLYYLALATAFGLIRRFDMGIGRFSVSVPAGFLMVEYDAADNYVRATVRFNTGLAFAAVTATNSFLSSALGLVPIVGKLVAGQIDAFNQDTANRAINLYSEAVVYSGPKEEVVGGPFNFTGVLTPAVPSTARSQGAPKLPFEGKTILTPSNVCPNPDPALPNGTNIPVDTPNPKPPGDNRSRGTFPVDNASVNDPFRGLTTQANGTQDMSRLLIPLVYAALSDPGGSGSMSFDPPRAGPQGF